MNAQKVCQTSFFGFYVPSSKFVLSRTYYFIGLRERKKETTFAKNFESIYSQIHHENCYIMESLTSQLMY